MAKSILKMINRLEKLVGKQLFDATKFDHGVNEPGRRVRAGMQEIRTLAKEVRDEIQSQKKARKAEKDVK